ncbi:MAG: putative maturation protein [Leviviridae sp.]|nr:MAG: putative maturation protein [Leviviridae sp.]
MTQTIPIQPAVSFTNFPVPNGETVSHLSLPTAPSNGVVMASVLAKTNPSRPVVDLPVAFAELRELPDLIRSVGSAILKGRQPFIKKAAGSYLAYEFGWKPLINDLADLLDFSDHFSKREKELRSIFEGGGVKRRRDYEDLIVTQITPSDTVYSNGTIIRQRSNKLTRRRIWGTTRWIPDSTKLAPRTSRDYRILARKTVLGLGVHPAALWQAMPWTWLVDWYGSMGDYLEAHRNSVPAIHLHGCVMTMTETYDHRSRPNGIDANTATVTGGTCTTYRVTKRRALQNNPTIGAYMPFLSNRQVSILGALSVVRGRR